MSATPPQRGVARGGALWPLMLPPADHGRADLCAMSAQGVRVSFADGSERLCGTSGLWNCPLGYGNRAVADAAHQALIDGSYLSAWGYENRYAREAAEVLIELSGSQHFSKVMFSTSGGSANDLAMKLVRHVAVLQGQPTRNVIIGLKGGFHGLTFGAFALTTSALGQRMYGVDRRLVSHVPPNDVAVLEALLANNPGRVAGVFVEPVIGTGAVPLTDDYVRGLLRLRREHDFLIVADEVSTGFCRVDSYFASAAWPEQPDLIITAKGLTNGTQAASAVISSHRIADAFDHAGAILGHAETQAGTPVACASITATVNEMRRLEAPKLSRDVASELDRLLLQLVNANDRVITSSGRGCLRALTLAGADGDVLPQEQVTSVVESVRSAGALVHPGPHGVQILPALVYSHEDLESLIARIHDALTLPVQGAAA